MNKTPLMVAGGLFAFFALIHLVRLIYNFPVVIGYYVPWWVSVLGLIIASGLSFWMFYSATRTNKKR